MSGATIKLSALDRVPIGRRFMPTRTIARFAAAVLGMAVCINILYAGQAKPKKHDNRHEIEQLEEAWSSAMLKSDTAAMGALLADDYIAITASGTLQTKDEALANLRNRRVHITALSVSDRKVRFYGQTALVNSLAEVQGTTPDGDVSGAFRYTRVYVCDALGKWKIVSFEASRIRNPSQQHR
jgi:ketosteroid isomerase-like protein